MRSTKINMANYFYSFRTTSVLTWTRAKCAGEAKKQNMKETKTSISTSQG